MAGPGPGSAVTGLSSVGGWVWVCCHRAVPGRWLGLGLLSQGCPRSVAGPG